MEGIHEHQRLFTWKEGFVLIYLISCIPNYPYTNNGAPYSYFKALPIAAMCTIQTFRGRIPIEQGASSSVLLINNYKLVVLLQLNHLCLRDTANEHLRERECVCIHPYRPTTLTQRKRHTERNNSLRGVKGVYPRILRESERETSRALSRVHTQTHKGAIKKRHSVEHTNTCAPARKHIGGANKTKTRRLKRNRSELRACVCVFQGVGGREGWGQ